MKMLKSRCTGCGSGLNYYEENPTNFINYCEKCDMYGVPEKRNHELKIRPEFFKFVEGGTKTFEYRKNDRGFLAGDLVTLKEWNPERVLDTKFDPLKGVNFSVEPIGYTGRELTFQIGYVLDVGDGNVVFSILPVKKK